MKKPVMSIYAILADLKKYKIDSGNAVSNVFINGIFVMCVSRISNSLRSQRKNQLFERRNMQLKM